MYRNLTYFKDIHIVAKVFSFFFCIWGICIVDNSIIFMTFVVSFFLFFRNKISFFLTVLFFGMNFFFKGFEGLMKLPMIVAVMILFLQTINFQEIRYFIECFFYHKKNSKVTSICLYICYFLKYYNIYFKEFLELRKSYGKSFSLSFLQSSIVQSFEKTKAQIDRLMVSYKYRFYNSMNHRTYVEKIRMNSTDLKCVLTFFIVFLLVYLYGR